MKAMKMLRYFALSIFSILIWIVTTWYAVIYANRTFTEFNNAGGYAMPFIAFGLGALCLYANQRVFRYAKGYAERRPKKSVSFFTGVLGYILLLVIAVTVIFGTLSAIQITDLYLK
jgi:hypothetical protein